MRRLALVVLTSLACGHPRLTSTAGSIEVSPVSLDFGDVPLTTTATLTLTLQNTSLSPTSGHVSSPAPFSFERDVTVPGGSSTSLDIVFAPQQLGPAAASLIFTVDGAAATVALAGNGAPAPICAGSIDYHTCDGTTQPDGTACASSNLCLGPGTCRQGVCLGQGISCDDGDVCTTDLCDPKSGCGHVETACPAPAEPCNAAFCDPVKGCGSAVSPDGTGCGPSDCTTAHICIAGQCKVMAVPDGYSCAGTNPCQGAGVCHAGACTQALPGPLVEAWHVARGPNEAALYFEGVTDAAGNLYWLEGTFTGFGGGAGGGYYSCDLVSYTPSGALRFRQPHSRSPAPPTRQLIAGGQFISVSAAAHFAASSLATGAQLFEVDGAPPTTPPAGGAGNLSGMMLVAVAADDSRIQAVDTLTGTLGVSVQEYRVSMTGAFSFNPLYAGTETALVLDLAGDRLSDATLFNNRGSTPPQLAEVTPSEVELFTVANPYGGPIATFDGEVMTDRGAVYATLSGGVLAAPAAGWSPMPRRAALMSSGMHWDLGSTDACAWCQECDCSETVTPIELRGYAAGSNTVQFDTHVADDVFPSDPVLLTTATVLLASRKNTEASTMLRAIDTQGHELFACPLPEPMSEGSLPATYAGPVALTQGKWAVIHQNHCGECVRDPDPYLQVFSVPGLVEAPTGWTGRYGGPARAGQPH